MAYTKVLISASTVAQDYWYHERGDVKFGLVKDVMSVWQMDIDIYDGETSRDSWGNDGDAQPTAGGTLVTLGNTTGAAFTVSADPGATSQSFPDEVSHIQPRPVLKKRSYLQFWSDAAGAGNLLYSIKEDRIISWGASEAPPAFIQ